MQSLSIGKLRGLQQCSTANQTLAILALDHRNNLRNAINPQSPQSVIDADMIAFKHQVVTHIGSLASAVLLDPEVGASQCVASGALPGTTGLVLAVESTGYTGDPMARESRILPGWSVAKARRMGASAVKLLVYYHPDSQTAKMIEDFVVQVAEDCRKEDIALFLEPLSYSIDPSKKKLAAEDRRRVVIETARRLVVPGVDILKAEFPVDIAHEPDEKSWGDACSELSAVCPVPWVLLSASVPFDVFVRQVTVACNSGATGVAVGRAVWQEAPELRGSERINFLETTASSRMRRANALCMALGRPWTTCYQTSVPEGNWYERY